MCTFKGQRSWAKSDSPSPAMEIEGRVEGEPDNRQTESGNNFHADMDDEGIQALIDNGDMEQLATLVLSGEGNRLVGMVSTQPEIQAFLDNIPAYIVR